MDTVKQTLEMDVDDIGFLIDRMGQDCDPLQYLRELTENSIQADAENIVWDIDWELFEQSNGEVMKLACIDDGCGMTGPEMVRYINHLSASRHRQALDGNFGVGAKIAALTRSPAGLVYQSWKDGEGAMVKLWRDTETGKYGLERWPLGDGEFREWVPIEDDRKPSLIKDHGTKVTLFGTSEDHQTIEAPREARMASRWVNKYLNDRYFRLPDGVKIKAREGWEKDPDSNSNVLRTVRGQGTYMDDKAEQMGVVELKNCRAHWWILPEKEKRSDATEMIQTGHVAMLHEDELYDLKTGKAATSMLMKFGVMFGHTRVAIYLEPTQQAGKMLTTNTARSRLRLDNEELTWDEWAEEFREDKMPDELIEHVDLASSGADKNDYEAALRERLERFKKLYELPRYRRNATGQDRISDPSIPAGIGDDVETAVGVDPARGQTNGSGVKGQGKASRALSGMLDNRGSKGIAEDTGLVIPNVIWISRSDDPPSREEGELEDRAATYSEENNLLKINKDYRGFADLITYWCRDRGLRDGHPWVEQLVKEWYELTLIEAIIGCKALEGSETWTIKDSEKALSEEALTAIANQRYHQSIRINHGLSLRLGSKQ